MQPKGSGRSGGRSERIFQRGPPSSLQGADNGFLLALCVSIWIRILDRLICTITRITCLYVPPKMYFILSWYNLNFRQHECITSPSDSRYLNRVISSGRYIWGGYARWNALTTVQFTLIMYVIVYTGSSIFRCTTWVVICSGILSVTRCVSFVRDFVSNRAAF